MTKEPEVEATTPEAEPKDTGKVEIPETAVEEEFDRERAMATILKLRETEKQYKKDKQELERIKAEEEKRKQAEMSEIEREKARADKLEAELKATRLENARNRVAAKYDLGQLAGRLQGETEEEIEADAKQLSELLPKPKKAPALNPTDIGDGKKGETDAQKRARIYNKGGDLFDVEGIKKNGGGVFFKDK